MKHLLVLCVVLVCEAANKNIVQLAEELGATTLIQYVKQAGLEGALSGQGKVNDLSMAKYTLYTITCITLFRMKKKSF